MIGAAALLAVLLLGPLALGVLLGVLGDAAWGLVELRALSRRHPGGIPLAAVPWHLRGHVAPIEGDRLSR